MDHLQVHAVLESGTPVVLFGDTVLVSFSKSGIMVQLYKFLSVRNDITIGTLTAVTAKLNWLMG